MHSWAEAGDPVRLLQKEPRKDDPEPKALSCYGLYLPELEETWLRFVDGRPVSAITTQFLEWCCQRLKARGKKALLLIWDNASWHKSRRGARLDRRPQPPGQSQRPWGSDSGVPVAHQEPVAQRYRAQVDPQQTQGHRAREIARRLRARRQGLRGLRLSALRASIHSPGGRLIVHEELGIAAGMIEAWARS